MIDGLVTLAHSLPASPAQLDTLGNSLVSAPGQRRRPFPVGERLQLTAQGRKRARPRPQRRHRRPSRRLDRHRGGRDRPPALRRGREVQAGEPLRPAVRSARDIRGVLQDPERGRLCRLVVVVGRVGGVLSGVGWEEVGEGGPAVVGGGGADGDDPEGREEGEPYLEGVGGACAAAGFGRSSTSVTLRSMEMVHTEGVVVVASRARQG